MGDFDETGGWPHQFYVREARRMVSDYVVTQNDMEAKTKPRHSVGVASYGVDDWSYATVAENGKVAAAMAVKDEVGVQDVAYAKLRPRLLALGQKLDVLTPAR